MKVSNLSSISFQKIYVVEEAPQSQLEILRQMGSPKKSATEKLYDLLSAGGANDKVRLMRNGGMFPDSVSTADIIEINSPPLLLIDDDVNTPAQRVSKLIADTNFELSEAEKMNIDELRVNLNEREVREAEERFEIGLIPDGKGFIAREFAFLERFKQKIRATAATNYKALYAEFAQGDIVKKPIELLSQVRQSIMDIAKSL